MCADLCPYSNPYTRKQIYYARVRVCERALVNVVFHSRQQQQRVSVETNCETPNPVSERQHQTQNFPTISE